MQLFALCCQFKRSNTKKQTKRNNLNKASNKNKAKYISFHFDMQNAMAIKIKNNLYSNEGEQYKIIESGNNCLFLFE